MSPTQTIDYTGGGVGWLIPWICIPVLVLLKGSIRKNAKAGLWGVLRVVLRRLLWGTIGAALLAGALQCWRCLGPQYFLQMEILEDRIVLQYPWPKPEITIPIHDLTNASTRFVQIRFRTYRRAELMSSSGKFRSVGFHESDLTDDEYRAWQGLRARIGTNSASPLQLEADPK